MAPHSSTLAWKILWTEEPGRLQSMESLRVGHDFRFHFHALEKEMATHSSVLAWRIPGMAGPGGLPSVGSHRVGLKRLSSSSKLPSRPGFNSSPEPLFNQGPGLSPPFLGSGDAAENRDHHQPPAPGPITQSLPVGFLASTLTLYPSSPHSIPIPPQFSSVQSLSRV